MASSSSLLPQALCTISTNSRQCVPQKKLLFSLSCFANSRVSRGSTSSPFASVKSRNSNNGWFSSSSSSSSFSFVVKAEGEEANAAIAEEKEPVEEEEEEEVVEDEVVERVPRKPIVKLGDIMGILNKRAIEASDHVRPIPDLRTGDIVEIRLEVPENRRRLSIYKGIVISKQNAGIHTTIQVRRIIAGVGVEIVFPIYSPNVKEIKVVKHRKVRRARLYYLRDKLPRLSTFK